MPTGDGRFETQLVQWRRLRLADGRWVHLVIEEDVQVRPVAPSDLGAIGYEQAADNWEPF